MGLALLFALGALAVALVAGVALLRAHQKIRSLEVEEGIGATFQSRLHEIGVSGYRQISEWNWHTIREMAEQIGTSPERIVRDRWVEQARELIQRRLGEPS